jgi:GNAT superfamily N-acetyltransferase
MYSYRKSNLDENRKFFNDYLNSLSGRYDEYLEDHILESQIYSVYYNEIHCGYFGIHENTMLTQFFTAKEFFKYAQAILTDILKKYDVKNAYVPTCDEILLSLCLDRHVKVNMKAYFFTEYNNEFASPEYPRNMLKLAELSDLDEIVEVTGDFIDRHEEKIKNRQLYVFRDKGEFLGLGVMIPSRIMNNCKCIGMFTNEKFRQRGIGRSIIIHLRNICIENGFTPLAGCWYYNHYSKRTLESTGFITKTRLLRIDF